LQSIAAKLEEMGRVHLDKGTARQEDLAFRLAIYDATQNPMFRQLLEQIHQAFRTFFDKPFERADFARSSSPFHRKLYEAIAPKTTGAAREYAAAILAITEENIKEMSR
jgi:DNA-binding FadR family transcriptional regulator